MAGSIYRDVGIDFIISLFVVIGLNVWYHNINEPQYELELEAYNRLWFCRTCGETQSEPWQIVR
jgi:hypothetical protein